MDRTENLLTLAAEICWTLFGIDYHTLEVNAWPRIASYYVAKRMRAGQENVFESLSEIAAAVHKYNRNLVTGQRFREDPREAAHAIASRGVLRFEGGDRFEQVTGSTAPGGWEDENRPTEEEGEPRE